MSVKIEHIEWPDRPDCMMPYSPGDQSHGGESTVFRRRDGGPRLPQPSPYSGRV